MAKNLENEENFREFLNQNMIHKWEK